MRILSRYFVARFLALFFATLFASTLAIVIVEMLLNLDDMLKGQSGPAGALGYLFLRIPSYYLRDLIPISTFVAAFFSVGLAASWRETIAFKAGGISPHRVAIPILAVMRMRFGDVVGYTFLIAVACFLASACAMFLIPPNL